MWPKWWWGGRDGGLDELYDNYDIGRKKNHLPGPCMLLQMTFQFCFVFVWLSNISLCISLCIYTIHSSVDELLCCFRILAIINNAIINNASMSIEVCISFPISDFFFNFGKYPEVKLLNHKAVLALFFWGITILFSIVTISIYNPTNSTQGFLFSTSSTTCYLLPFFVF